MNLQVDGVMKRFEKRNNSRKIIMNANLWGIR